MCTGAEIPAALAATAGTAAAGTAGTAAAASAGAAAAGAGLDAGLTALTAAPEMAAGMASTSAVPGLLGAAPDMAGFEAGLGPTFGAGGMGMTDAGGSTIAGAPQAANPFSIGMGNFQNSTMGQGLGRGMDALGNANKTQAAINAFSPQRSSTTSISRPPGMGQPAQNVSQGSMGRPMGGLMGNPQQGGLDSAKLMMLKRMGLLGSM